MVVLEEGLHFLRPLWMKLSWQYFHQHPDVLVNVFHGEMLNWRKNAVFFSGQKHSVSNVMKVTGFCFIQHFITCLVLKWGPVLFLLTMGMFHSGNLHVEMFTSG